MPQRAVVKKYFPERGYGFLFNPSGGKDIFIRNCGRRLEEGGALVPLREDDGSTAPKPGAEVEILALRDDPQKGPRATQWRLV